MSPRARRTTLAISAAALALIATAPAFADVKYSFIEEQKPTEYLAKDRLLNAKIRDDNGKIVGDIEDLIIGNDDQVVGVIMGVGGLMGLGEKKVAVATKALKLEVTDGKMRVTMPGVTKKVLTDAPAYKRIKPPKGMFERAVEKGQELSDKAKETATDAYNKAKEEAGPAYEAAKKKAQEAVDKAKEAAKPATGAGSTP